MLIVTGLSAFSISVSALANSCGRLCDPVWVHSATVDDVRNELELGADVSDVFDSLERYPGTLDFHKTPFLTLTPYFDGATALHFFALLNSRRNAVELLIDSGSSLEEANLNGATSLHLASGGMGVATGLLIFTHLRIRVEDDLKQINRYSRASSLDEIRLHARVLESRLNLSGNIPEIVALLIDRGSNVNAKDVFGATALHRAAAANTRLEVIRLLVDRGSSIDAADYKNWTPLHKALTFNSNSSISKFLVDQGADVFRVSDVGSTLHHAAINWNPGVLKLLLKRGIDIDIRNGKGQTPLHLSARNLIPDVSSILLDHGAYLESEDMMGDTPLHRAIRSRNYFAVINLIGRGADIDAKDRYGETPREVLREWRSSSAHLEELLDEALVSGRQPPGWNGASSERSGRK